MGQGNTYDVFQTWLIVLVKLNSCIIMPHAPIDSSCMHDQQMVIDDQSSPQYWYFNLQLAISI